MSIRGLAGILLVAGVVACAPIMRVHGYVPLQTDLELLAVGADTKASVEETVGRPSDTGVLETGAWYYVESTVRTFLYLEPTVVERRVMVLDFDANDVLTGVSEFGLENGQVINLQTRITPTDRRRTGILSALLGNVGAIAPPIPSN